MKKYYSGEPVNIHIKLSIKIIQYKNWVITTKKGYGKITIILWECRTGNSHP